MSCPMTLCLGNNQRNEEQPDQSLIVDKRLFCAAAMPISPANPSAAMVTAALAWRGFCSSPRRAEPGKPAPCPKRRGGAAGSPIHTRHRDDQSFLPTEALPCHWALRSGLSKFLTSRLRYYLKKKKNSAAAWVGRDQLCPISCFSGIRNSLTSWHS